MKSAALFETGTLIEWEECVNHLTVKRLAASKHNATNIC